MVWRIVKTLSSATQQSMKFPQGRVAQVRYIHAALALVELVVWVVWHIVGAAGNRNRSWLGKAARNQCAAVEFAGPKFGREISFSVASGGPTACRRTIA